MLKARAFEFASVGEEGWSPRTIALSAAISAALLLAAGLSFHPAAADIARAVGLRSSNSAAGNETEPVDVHAGPEPAGPGSPGAAPAGPELASQWRLQRPLMDEAAHAFPGDDINIMYTIPCASIQCRKDDHSCPHTDKTCCTYWLRNLLEFVGWLFTSRKQKFVLAWGTLLGAYRNGTILPWDKDLDLIAHEELFKWMNDHNDTSFRRQIWRYGYVLHPSPRGPYPFPQVCFHRGHPDLSSDQDGPPPVVADVGPYPFIDVYEATPVGPDEYDVESGESAPWRIKNLTFTKLYSINGLDLPGVDDAEYHLTKSYGNFRTPKIDPY